jgi:predicted ArsR family transcriptional regulator
MNSLDHRIADGSSRAGVLRVLRERGDLVRVEDLAGAVSLSLSAVRFHLDRLIADGLVRTAKEPRLTPGRPRVMYQAVPEEAVDEAAAYRRLASLLAAELADHGGRAAAEDAGRAWAEQVMPVRVDQVERRLAADRLAGTLGEVPDSLPDVLTVLEDGGFAPKVLDGGWTIELHRCPYGELMATQSDMVCSVHRGLLRSIPEVGGTQNAVRLYPAPDAAAPCVVRFQR